MSAESSGYCTNLAVTEQSPQDFQENEAAEISLGARMCNVTKSLKRLLFFISPYIHHMGHLRHVLIGTKTSDSLKSKFNSNYE